MAKKSFVWMAPRHLVPPGGNNYLLFQAQSPVGRQTSRFEEFSALPRGDSRARER